MGAKKDKGEPIKCRCPRCKKEYEAHIFVFNHNPNRFYPKYCSDCQGAAERSYADYTENGTYWIKCGLKSKAD